MPYTEIVGEAGDRVISTLKSAQDAAVTTVSQVSGTVGKIVPQIPTNRLTERIPNPGAFVESYFDFVSQVVDLQKDYALGLLEALTPLTGKVLPNAKPRKARKSKSATASNGS